MRERDGGRLEDSLSNSSPGREKKEGKGGRHAGEQLEK